MIRRQFEFQIRTLDAKGFVSNFKMKVKAETYHAAESDVFAHTMRPGLIAVRILKARDMDRKANG